MWMSEKCIQEPNKLHSFFIFLKSIVQIWSLSSIWACEWQFSCEGLMTWIVLWIESHNVTVVDESKHITVDKDYEVKSLTLGQMGRCYVSETNMKDIRQLLAENEKCQKKCQNFGICQNIGIIFGMCQNFGIIFGAPIFWSANIFW